MNVLGVFKDLLIFIICALAGLLACMSVKVPDLLELELQRVMSYLEGAGD